MNQQAQWDNNERIQQQELWSLTTYTTIFEDRTASSDFEQQQLVVALDSSFANRSKPTTLHPRNQLKSEKGNSRDSLEKQKPEKDVPIPAVIMGIDYGDKVAMAQLDGNPSLDIPWKGPENPETPATSETQASTSGENPRATEDMPARILALTLNQPVSPPASQYDFESHFPGGLSAEELVKVLKERNDVLMAENAKLKSTVGGNKETPAKNVKIAYKWESLYRFEKSTYLAEPSWVATGTKIFELKGNLQISSPSAYLERHAEIAFVEYKDYTQCQKIATEMDDSANLMSLPNPSAEFIRLIAPEMSQALRAFLDHVPDFTKMFPRFRDVEMGQEIPAPYLFWYCSRPYAPKALDAISSSHRALVELLQECIERGYGKEYDFANSKFAEGMMAPSLMIYFIRPGDVVVNFSRNRPGEAAVSFSQNHVKAFLAISWTNAKFHYDASDHAAISRWMRNVEDPPEKTSPEDVTKKLSYKSNFQCWNWDFDGNFHPVEWSHEVRLDRFPGQREIKIVDMETYPLKYAHNDVKQLLARRGRIFWSCRHKKIVSYMADVDDQLQTSGERFMVDVATYQQYRKKKDKDRFGTTAPPPTKPVSDTMGTEKLAQDTSPKEPHLLLFPNTIVGYNLRTKKWVDLDVDHICEVSWNKKAFETLAIDDETKELVEALVTNQIEASKATDLMSGKGNGLLILLHGGPGTGKTFTAESVAEFAEKPLYRVTCGDIGTQPEAVESYLDSVLHLGKIWDCVVLLDEADVFLEERAQSDLDRNALVSVFLRILEYYEGILFLTSNRVGTFDEAFKSRIQLILHYENLTPPQRRKIWRNFMERLKSLGETHVDYDDINDHIDELIQYEMNGRQIRNAITTARQLAQFRKKDFSFSHLKHVIGIANKFDDYLKRVKEGFTADQLARDAGHR